MAIGLMASAAASVANAIAAASRKRAKATNRAKNHTATTRPNRSKIRPGPARRAHRSSSPGRNATTRRSPTAATCPPSCCAR